MSNNKDHTVLIVICILLGIVLTISVAIIGSVYNNNQNIQRDKYLFSHCQAVTKETVVTDITSNRYKCGA